MANNHYSNVIAPSDGVRRFLCETCVLFLGLAAVLYSVFAYRMNAFEYETLGSSMRSTLLYAAYVMVPLGILTAGAFSRIKQLGDAFGMISLIVTALGMFLLFLNSIASLKYERNFQGILGSGLEFLTFALAVAVFVNLTMSCMEFRIVPILGDIGAICAVLALVITAIRTVGAFSSMNFAWDGKFTWNSEFDWNNLATEVQNAHLEYQAKWIFRNIKMNDPAGLKRMFTLRLFERVTACLWYGVFAVFFLRYKREMKSFNKLMEHASEYVDIPTINIADSLAKTEQVISEKIKSGGDSVKTRLQKLNDMTKAKEQGLDISVMSDEWDKERRRDWEEDDGGERPRRRRSEDGYAEERPRRRRSEDDYDEERPRRRRSEEDYDEERPRRRRSEDDYDEERPRRRRSEDDLGEERPRRRRSEDDYDEERPRRRRSEDDLGEERPRRRRSEDDYDEERPRRRRSEDDYDEERPRRRRSEDDLGEERPRRRRSEDDYDEERPRRRRSEDDYDEERPRRRRSEDDLDEERPRRRRSETVEEEDELTEEERYLMEERRKRYPNSDSRGQRRPKRASRSSEDDYRQRRGERLSSRESDMQKSMNNYYDNYMQVREERARKNNSGHTGGEM